MSKLLKEKPNLDHLRIRLASETPAAKNIFLQLIKGSTEIVRSDDPGLPDRDSGFGCCEVDLVRTSRGTRVENPRIFIIKDDFGKKGQSSIEPIKHHEAVEVYELARRKSRPADAKMVNGYSWESRECHLRALEEEFEFAFEIGVAEKHLDFMALATNRYADPAQRRELVKEDQVAYNKARTRFLARAKG